MFREAGLSLGGGARSSGSGAAAASRPKESAEVRTSNWCEAPRTPALRSSQEELERDADERVALVTVLSLLAPPPRPRGGMSIVVLEITSVTRQASRIHQYPLGLCTSPVSWALLRRTGTSLNQLYRNLRLKKDSNYRELIRRSFTGGTTLSTSGVHPSTQSMFHLTAAVSNCAPSVDNTINRSLSPPPVPSASLSPFSPPRSIAQMGLFVFHTPYFSFTAASSAGGETASRARRVNPPLSDIDSAAAVPPSR